MAINVLLIIGCYFLGNISPSIIITKLLTKKDIRQQGSGNAGTTNVLRTLGPAAAAATLIIDIAKGVGAVLIGKYFGVYGAASSIGIIGGADGPTAIFLASTGLGGQSAAIVTNVLINQDMAMACGLAAFIGHIWPIIFGFKGGKGVATGLGVVMTVIPGVAWISVLIGLAVILLSKRVSLGAIIGFCTLPAVAYFYDPMYVSWAIIFAIIVVIKHRKNIVRLVKGTEPKLSFGKKGDRHE